MPWGPANAGDTNVDVAVRWSEAGQEIPAKTAAQLKGLGQAAAGAGVEIGDRLSTAFARLEARSPAMMMRRISMAVEELGASAIGAQGPWGRLLMAFGGLSNLGIVASVAAIGLEVKTLTEYAGELERTLVKVNTEFAGLGGAGSTQLRGIEALGTREPEQPGMFGRLIARLGTIGQLAFTAHGDESDVGDQQAAIEEGMAAQQATFDTAGNLMMRQFHKRADDVRHRHAEQQRSAAVTARHAELSRIGLEAPDRAIHDLLANRQRFQSLGAEAAAEWAKAFLDAVKASGLGPTLRAGFQPGFLGGGTRFAFSSSDGSPVRGLGETPTFGAFGPEADRKTFAGIDHGPAGLTFADIDRPSRRFDADPRAAQNAERNAERMGTVLARELGPLIVMMSGGGARAAVGGLSAITGTMASLRDAKGAAVLGSATGPLSIASGLLGGLTALLGGGGQKPKVIITAFEEQAARQIKELRGEPLTTQIIVIGAVDMRQTQQALARLVRLGVITRLP